MRKTLLVGALFAAISLGAHAAPPLMSAEWADLACKSWNENPILTDELAGDWIKNDQKRGFKIIHMYRTDCGEDTKVEMIISAKNSKAMCTSAGKINHTALNFDSDYVMHAETKRWNEMGAGDYGPMRAMMFGRLKFHGPKMEAMSVMGPFEQFLLMPGKVPGDAACPAK